MMDVQTDVLVVGAGPAGSTAATFLAREGLDVRLVDRATFPRDKVCGDALTPRALVVLQRLGLDARLRATGYQPLREFLAVSTRGKLIKTPIPCPKDGPDYAYVVPRRELDLMLLECARAAGADVWDGTRVLELEHERLASPVGVCLTPGGEVVRVGARFVIAADGSRGSLSRQLRRSRRRRPPAIGVRAYMEGVEGVDETLNFFLERRLLPGYGWIFPGGKEHAPANVGVLIRTGASPRHRQSLRELFNDFVGPGSLAWPYLRQARLLSTSAAFPLEMGFIKAFSPRDRVLFVGDAAGLINPLSGEGIAHALESGQAAARALAFAIATGQLGVLADYAAAIRRTQLLEFMAARLVRGLLARPWADGLGNEIVAHLVKHGGLLGNTVSGGFKRTVG